MELHFLLLSLLLRTCLAFDMSDYDKEALDKTIWLEARGEPREGQIAVAHVIRNRMIANREYMGGSTARGVCLHARQFEPWNNQQPNNVHPESSNDAGIYRQIQGWSRRVMDGEIADNTMGALYINNPKIEGPLENRIKGIAKTVVIGQHHFYKEGSADVGLLSPKACKKWHAVVGGDTCWNVWTANRMTMAEFYALNPSHHCDALRLGQRLCIGSRRNRRDKGTKFSNTNCKLWHTAQLGDFCYAIWTANNIPESEFERLNPDMQNICHLLMAGTKVCIDYNPDRACMTTYHTIQPRETCHRLWGRYGISAKFFMENNKGIDCDHLIVGQKVCIDKEASTGCEHLHIVLKDEHCYSIQQKYAISEEQFNRTNPNLNCSNIHPGYRVCIDKDNRIFSASFWKRPIFYAIIGFVICGVASVMICCILALKNHFNVNYTIVRSTKAISKGHEMKEILPTNPSITSKEKINFRGSSHIYAD